MRYTAIARGTSVVVIFGDAWAGKASSSFSSTLRVLAQHHLIPDPHKIECVDLDQTQPTYFTGLFRNAVRVFNGLAKTPRSLRCFGAHRAGSRQSEVA